LLLGDWGSRRRGGLLRKVPSDFHLANVLLALYPKGGEQKGFGDAMLFAKQIEGF